MERKQSAAKQNRVKPSTQLLRSSPPLLSTFTQSTLFSTCRHLDVSVNGMEGIAERAFHNVTKLQTLELGSNRLDNFPTRTFVPLMDLRTFSAPGNRLPYIPVAVQGRYSVLS